MSKVCRRCDRPIGPFEDELCIPCENKFLVAWFLFLVAKTVFIVIAATVLLNEIGTRIERACSCHGIIERGTR